MNEIWKKNREKLLARMEMFSAAVLFAGKAPIKRGDENYPFSPDRNFYSPGTLAQQEDDEFHGRRSRWGNVIWKE